MPFAPGQSGNPNGRPAGSRQKIAEALLADIHEVWQACGLAVLKRLAAEEPAKFAQIAYGLVPRDIFLQVAPAAPANLEPQEWAALVNLLRIPRDLGAEGSPLEIAERCEAAIRAEFSRPVLELPAPPPL